MVVLSLALLACILPAAFSSPPGKNKKAPAAYALIAGTVFRESGMALPQAEVIILPESTAGPAKPKKAEILTDRRGEFAVRVPAGPMRYTVTVKAAGFQTQQKPVSITGEERVDVFFQLEPASKQ